MSQPSPSDISRETAALLHLLQLGGRARAAESIAELGFIAVNETRTLLPYRQAVLWLDEEGVKALSGVTTVDGNAPYVQWLERVIKQVQERSPSAATQFTSASVLEQDRDQWAEWWPQYALWLPITDTDGNLGAWIFVRDQSWSDSEIAILSEWSALWKQSWKLKEPNEKRGLPHIFRKLRQSLAPSKQAYSTSFYPIAGDVCSSLLKTNLFACLV